MITRNPWSLGLLGMALPLLAPATNSDTTDWMLARTTFGHQIAYVQDGDVMLSDDVMAYPDQILSIKRMNSSEALDILQKLAASETADKPHVEIARLWNTRQLLYRVDPTMPEAQRGAVTAAIAEWNAKSRFRFVPVKQGQSPMVVLGPTAKGCRANLGMPSPGQGPAKVHLGSTCDKQSVIHELGHIIGMQHEHQRSTRDRNLTVRQDTLEHIRTAFPNLYQSVLFNLQRVEGNLGDPFPFDYQSAMLYGSYPRNNAELEADLRQRKLPLFTDLDGKEIDRPTAGLTGKDIQRAHRIDLLRYWGTGSILNNSNMQ